MPALSTLDERFVTVFQSLKSLMSHQISHALAKYFERKQLQIAHFCLMEGQQGFSKRSVFFSIGIYPAFV